jgi:hypothetical protein
VEEPELECKVKGSRPLNKNLVSIPPLQRKTKVNLF